MSKYLSFLSLEYLKYLSKVECLTNQRRESVNSRLISLIVDPFVHHENVITRCSTHCTMQLRTFRNTLFDAKIQFGCFFLRITSLPTMFNGEVFVRAAF